MTHTAPHDPPPLALYLAWVFAFVATLGSLFFGEVMKYVPCTLCWYQRICLYPLVFILPVGIVLRDARAAWYALPLAAVGTLIALYHNLIYYGVIPEDLSPCTGTVPCSTRQVELFGFITIPLMGLGAFVAIVTVLVAHLANQRKNA